MQEGFCPSHRTLRILHVVQASPGEEGERDVSDCSEPRASSTRWQAHLWPEQGCSGKYASPWSTKGGGEQQASQASEAVEKDCGAKATAIVREIARESLLTAPPSLSTVFCTSVVACREEEQVEPTSSKAILSPCRPPARHRERAGRQLRSATPQIASSNEALYQSSISDALQ